jgi:hypothetical protein
MKPMVRCFSWAMLTEGQPAVCIQGVFCSPDFRLHHTQTGVDPLTGAPLGSNVRCNKQSPPLCTAASTMPAIMHNALLPLDLDCMLSRRIEVVKRQ